MSEQDYIQLTLFPEDSPVNRFPLPGSEEARMMTASSGRKWLGLSKNSGPLGLLEKMLLESLRWHSPIFYLNWKPVDIGQGHFLFQLALSEPDTGATGLQLWVGTPTAGTGTKGRSVKWRKGKTPNPQEFVQEHPEKEVQMWPTPKASMRGDCPSERSRRSPDLSAMVKMYNTPTAQDAKNSTFPASQKNRDSLVGDVMREMFATPQARDYRTGQEKRWKDRNRSKDLNDQIAMYPTPTTGAGLCGGTGNYQQLKKLEKNGVITEEERRNMSRGNGGQLNPDWVEWLMGFPVGWTKI